MSFTRAFTPIALTVFIALSVIIGSLSTSYYISEHTESDLTHHVVAAYIKNSRNTLRSLVLDNSWWNHAFLNITYRPDPEWVVQSYATSDLLNDPIHGIVILQNDGAIKYQFTRDNKEEYAFSQTFFLEHFATLKQKALAFPENRPEPVFFNGVSDGSPTLFAMSPITYFQWDTRPEFPANKRDFLVFYYILTPDELAQKGEDLGIASLHASQTPTSNSIPIRDADGRILSHITWSLMAKASNYLSLTLLISIMMFGLLLIGGYISFTRISELIHQTETAKAVAEKGHSIKTNFLATMSHELRTPLNSIIGFSNILQSDTNKTLDETQKEYLHYIEKSGNHLLEIINEILDLSKIEAGKYELYESEVEIHRIIHEAAIYISSAASDKNITIIKEFPDTHYELMGDEKVIKQLLLNLLSNAVKFTPENGEITIGYHLGPRQNIQIFVQDNGIGISAEKLAIITEPYLQDQDHKTRSHGGTGLGLTISKAFIELHQGEMTIESALNHGTKVLLTFPSVRLLPHHL
ncbi:ATP-binding protein [Paremcibacter congregatus]|uniref:histidine kinase n=1 Tax=Paremcibacter congregatus TaxID=2043170 RepID=A0A2G4YMC7_9PROT|nr:ATP-binding protein [Paremcibacter congregatus]PHZ83489.1 hypothetical protein CRD36_18220 [Paremcibacter congregatus]QDE28044.1 hypothetical protein FIV45_12585 [Paremcibacter congregatus]